MWWGISCIAALFLNSAARALPQGYLGDLLPMGPEEFDPITTHMEQASIPSQQTTPSLPDLTTHAAQLTATPGVSSHSHTRPLAHLTSIPTPASQLPTPTPEESGNDTHLNVIATSTSQNSASPTSTGYPSPSPADSELSQGHTVDWRMIGIAVIAVSVVGTMILVVVFFDQWWGFLCDVCGHRRRWYGGGKEELVPDWQRASWEFKIEGEDLPEYPSFGSPPAMQAQVQEGPITHMQSPQVEMVQRHNKNASPTHLGVPPTWALKDNGEVLGTQGVPYRPPIRHPKTFSPSGVVDEARAYKFHSPLSRSDTLKSTATEDAYDGLAA